MLLALVRFQIVLFVSLSLPCRIRGTVAQSARSSGLQETLDMKIVDIYTYIT